MSNTLSKNITNSFRTDVIIRSTTNHSLHSFLRLGKVKTVILQLEKIYKILLEQEESENIDFVENVSLIKNTVIDYYSQVILGDHLLIKLALEDDHEQQNNTLVVASVDLKRKLTSICDFHKVVEFVIARIYHQYKISKYDFSTTLTFCSILQQLNLPINCPQYTTMLDKIKDSIAVNLNGNISRAGAVLLAPNSVKYINEDKTNYILDNSFVYSLFIEALEKDNTLKIKQIIANLCEIMPLELLFHCICNAWIKSSFLLNTNFVTPRDTASQDPNSLLFPFLRYAVKSTSFVHERFFIDDNGFYPNPKPEHLICMAEVHDMLMSSNK